MYMLHDANVMNDRTNAMVHMLSSKRPLADAVRISRLTNWAAISVIALIVVFFFCVLLFFVIIERPEDYFALLFVVCLYF